MHEGFDTTQHAVRSQAEATREAIHADGDVTRQAMKQVHFYIRSVLSTRLTIVLDGYRYSRYVKHYCDLAHFAEMPPSWAYAAVCTGGTI